MLLRLAFLSLALALAGCSAGRGLSSVEGFDAPCEANAGVANRSASPLSVSESPPRLIGGVDGLNKRMRYPYEARRLELEGQVCLEIVVTDEGQVGTVEITRSIHPLLDAEAVRAVRASSFEPARRDGEPVASRLSMTMQYTLIGGSDSMRHIAGAAVVLLAAVAAYYLLAVPSD